MYIANINLMVATNQISIINIHNKRERNSNITLKIVIISQGKKGRYKQKRTMKVTRK